ncbi:hypothetical protein N7519_010759 [Penicillium mononematosum]|uniref:uncharacterized protein n=1 Tax=Penicillium mononematosum TaxID=268346 RepID=UPI0025487470|nr:uncharacterized protein N7519_010759 [Penicillium mononematosum]KAJ6180298.1 hypothetical protein N7519_010759 [Penicillium mononematosum]
MTTVDTILAAKYPAKAHALRVAESLKARHGGAGVIYLEAQKTRLIEDSDEDMPFRQRRPFFYLTGCLLPNAAVVYDAVKDELTLFIPPINPESVIWSGLPLSPEEAAELYDVDRVLFTTDVNSTLASIASSHNGQSAAFAIAEHVSEGTIFQGFAETNTTSLKTAIEETRVIKDAYEVALLRKANDISTKAHVAAIHASKTATNEREIEAAIIGACIANGCREQNDVDLVDPITKQRKNNVLIDAGGEYQTYCADITRVIPLNGRFAPETRQIYEIVLQMQTECIAMLKEGVCWDDVHALAHRIAIRGLLKLGILRGSEDELFEKRVSVAFFPMVSDTMFRYLRVRANLPAGSVVTVEPGIYFCRFIIDPVLKAPETGKYIDTEVLERYWSVGGVRIEDNIHITKDGSENLTTAPKSIEEVESLAL